YYRFSSSRAVADKHHFASHPLLFSVFLLPVHVSFFFTDTATTEIYTLSLHDALPIFPTAVLALLPITLPQGNYDEQRRARQLEEDRKSTRLNSSHVEISYAVFCLKKKKERRRTSVPAQRATCSFIDVSSPAHTEIGPT